MPTQLQLTSLVTYDKVKAVDYIISEMEQGWFFNSAQLVDQVLRNSRILATVQTRIIGLLGKARDVDPAKPDDGRTKSTAQKVADEVNEEWCKLFPHAQLVELMTWGLLHNSGLARVDQSGEAWQLEVWHPWALEWSDVERAYFVRTREDQRLRIDPDGQGGYRSQDGTRWVLFTPFGFGNLRRALIRVLAHLYLELEWAHRDRARYSEVHGQPIRVGIAPHNASQEQCDKFEDDLSPVGAEPVVVARQGVEGERWDVKLVEAMGKSGDLFENEIEQLHKEIATLLLGQSQTTDGQAGLGANQLAGEPIRLDVMKADAEALIDCLYPQFLKPYCGFRYGKPGLAPRIYYHVDPPEDREKKAKEVKLIMEAIGLAKGSGIPIDEREVLEEYSIAALAPGQEAVVLVPPAPKNGAMKPQQQGEA